MNSTTRRIAVAAGAAVLSAALFYFGTGMRPVPWLTWLAPLPVLLLAPRVGARIACCAAGPRGSSGGRMWDYFLGTLGCRSRPMAP